MKNLNPDTLKYTVIFSARRTLGISVKRDASVVIRVPFGTPESIIKKLVIDKKDWILRHSAWFRDNHGKPTRKYIDGEMHLFRGKYLPLNISLSEKPYCTFTGESIKLGTMSTDIQIVRKILYKGYRQEALKIFPGMMEMLVETYRDKGLIPSGLKIRTMKSRWGSCSRSGLITLNSDLVRLEDTYIKYVMKHELCHLQHHDHGKGYYLLLSELCPDWKKIRNEMRKFVM